MKKSAIRPLLALAALAAASCDNKPAEKTTSVPPASQPPKPAANQPAAQPTPPPTTFGETPPAVISTDGPPNFSVPEANTFFNDYKAINARITEALNAGDLDKLRPLLAEAGTMHMLARKKWFTAVKPEERVLFNAYFAAYSKPFKEGNAKIRPNPLEKLVPQSARPQGTAPVPATPTPPVK